jgi:ABC-type transport system involved in multi-copper enzyme maturation permease subunit
VKPLKAIFMLEFKKLLNKKVIGLFLFFSLLSLYFVQIGINHYKEIIESKDRFQDIERLKVNQYINYGQYGSYGFRILFIPSPLSIYFFNSCTISELTSNVDSGERLNIYNSFKGRTLFAEKAGGYKDFSGIMLLLGSLLVLYFGYESLIHKDYLRFMSDFIDYKKLFSYIIFSRILVFILFFLFNTGISLILLKVNAVAFSNHEYLQLAIYMGTLVLMLMFFFALGTIAGTFKSRFAGFVLVIVSWFVFVFLIPGVVSTSTSQKADNIASNYHLELEKLKRLMDFEKRALEDVGLTSKENIEEVRKYMEHYWNNEFNQIRALERKLETEMKKNIRHFQRLSFLFPSTFYLASTNEISSKGYENFITFFRYIQILKKDFVRFFINKRYYSNYYYSKVEPFVKNNENLFYARSRLPKGFFYGVLLTVAYILVLFAVSLVRFKKSLKQ